MEGRSRSLHQSDRRPSRAVRNLSLPSGGTAGAGLNGSFRSAVSNLSTSMHGISEGNQLAGVDSRYRQGSARSVSEEYMAGGDIHNFPFPPTRGSSEGNQRRLHGGVARAPPQRGPDMANHPKRGPPKRGKDSDMESLASGHADQRQRDRERLANAILGPRPPEEGRSERAWRDRAVSSSGANNVENNVPPRSRSPGPSGGRPSGDYPPTGGRPGPHPPRPSDRRGRPSVAAHPTYPQHPYDPGRNHQNDYLKSRFKLLAIVAALMAAMVMSYGETQGGGGGPYTTVERELVKK